MKRAGWNTNGIPANGRQKDGSVHVSFWGVCARRAKKLKKQEDRQMGKNVDVGDG